LAVFRDSTRELMTSFRRQERPAYASPVRV
jgi:hypothetical protein